MGVHAPDLVSALADIPQCNRHVRCTPESGHFARGPVMCAKCQ